MSIRLHGALSAIACVVLTGIVPVCAQERAFVELTSPRHSYFAGEPIELRVQFGIEQQFLRENMIQLFRQRLEVPVQLELPWLRNLPGATHLPARARNPGVGLSSIALNSKVVSVARAADRRIGDRQFTVLEIRESYLPTRVGTLEVRGPILRFAHATRFEEDFVRGRIAVDRRDESVRCDPLLLTIRPLPEVGRPPEFGGAVGRFSVRAVADRTEVAVGEIFKLVLHIRGTGNLSTFDTPSLGQLTDFHVYGTLDDKGRAETSHRTITYELAPLRRGVSRVPPIRFAYFDPNPEARYHTLRTEPIPLIVRTRRDGASQPPLPTPTLVPGTNDIFDIKSLANLPPATTSPAAATPVYAFLFLVPWLLAFGFRSLLRTRARNRPAADQLRVRQAAAAFRARADGPRADLADDLVEFLAAALRCSPAAVIGPDLRGRLATAGVSDAIALRATSLFDAISAPKYRGDAPSNRAPGPGGNPAEAAGELVDAIAGDIAAALNDTSRRVH